MIYNVYYAIYNIYIIIYDITYITDINYYVWYNYTMYQI